MLSKTELVNAIREDFPDWSDVTITMRISELKKEGIVQNPSRGIYTINQKANYDPDISPKLKKLNNTLKKQFPFVRFCVWDTIWLNEFMLHQPFRFYLVAEVEKDVIESVFYLLSESYSKIFLNPNAEVFERYVFLVENPLIIKPLISESPIELVDGMNVPKLEKLLVDLLIDKDLYGSQQFEIDFIYKSAFEKYTINLGMMKRYARRRNREKEVLNVLDSIATHIV